MEEWRPVLGFDMYEVSNQGRVRNTQTGRTLRPSIDAGGYCNVSLRRDGRGHCRGVHRLVAQAFIGDVRELDVNHEDLNKLNNCVHNLTIMTRRENVEHAVRHRARMSKVDTINIRCVETGEIFNSIRDAARYVKISSKTLADHLSGKLDKVRGYTFEITDQTSPDRPKKFVKRSTSRVFVKEEISGEIFESASRASMELGIPLFDIMRCLNLQTESVGAYRFIWLD